MPTPKKQQQTYNRYLQYSGIGFQMMSAIAICAWLGSLADEKLGTEKPFVTVIAMLFGVSVSIYLMVHSIKRLNEKARREHEQDSS